MMVYDDGWWWFDDDDDDDDDDSISPQVAIGLIEKTSIVFRYQASNGLVPGAIRSQHKGNPFQSSWCFWKIHRGKVTAKGT